MWDLKYRPLTFGDVLGQEAAVLVLKARLAKGTALDMSYVFSGGHGQGKTSLARILARALLCQNLDKSNPEPCNECENCRDILDETSLAYVEQDAASRGTIDHVRAIVADLPFAVINAPKRIYVFDEAHRMSKDAQDVLLKPLEDKKMVGIFCTTEPTKLRGAILSRSEEYPIRKITNEDVLVRMKKILNAEGVLHDDDAVLAVIEHSGGHVRDVINRLEMISQAGSISIASVREYLHLNVVSVYYEILLALGDTKRAIELVEQALESVSAEDLTAGLAEAAMNSFRLAHGLYTEFLYVDRTMGQKLWDCHGSLCIAYAEYFLQSRVATKAGVICDVINLSGGAPPIRQAPVSLPAPQLTPAPIAAPIVPASTLPAPAHAPAAPLQASPPVVVQNPVKRGCRLDGVGNLGSDDAAALGENDIVTVPREGPRGRVHQPVPSVFATADASLSNQLKVHTPEEWRREFSRTWPGQR